MNSEQFPEEIEKYIINYFNYANKLIFCLVCKRWRKYNIHIIELNNFLKHTFECCITYPVSDGNTDIIQLLELESGSRRGWNNENLLNYKYNQYPPSTPTILDICENGEELFAERAKKLNQIKYNTGHFNELDMLSKCQTKNSMVQLTYYPSEFEFSSRFKDTINQLKKKSESVEKTLFTL